jgi:hypothetical protein
LLLSFIINKNITQIGVIVKGKVIHHPRVFSRIE